MPEISDLLERTTPSRPPAFDVDDLARRGRRRRRRAQVGTGMGAVIAIAAAVVGLGLVAPGDEGKDRGQVVDVVATRPPTGEVAQAFAAAAEPIGTWEQVADPPFSPRMDTFTATTSDGRVVVWGGSSDTEGPRTLTDGGVFDPEAETWEAIPPAPLPPGVQVDPIPSLIQLAEDRLMVLASPNSPGPVSAAVYDLATRSWTEIEPPPSIELPAEGIAWTGETLALVRFWSGASVDIVAKYTEPVVERWSYETGEWETGTRPPLSNRVGPAVAFDGERLGVWSGVTQEVAIGSPATGAELVGDGALYDVAADRWEPIATGPLPPAEGATATWLPSGHLAIAGGFAEDRSGSPTMGSGITGMHIMPVDAAAAYDAASKSWTILPKAPSTPYDDQQGVPYRILDEAEPPFLGVDPRESGPHPIHVYDELTRSWLGVPLRDLHTVDGTLVATSRTPDNPAGAPFEVRVLAGSVWEPATQAPFVNRMGAGVTVTGQNMFVVGGAEGHDLRITGDAWLLRFDVDSGD